MTKKNYKKIGYTPWFNPWTGETENQWSNSAIGRYDFKHSFYRYPKTFNEKRQNKAALEDGHKVRGRRRGYAIPTCYDDKRFSRNWKRSWKDFTKAKKQYMTNL